MFKYTVNVPGGTVEVPGDSLEATIRTAEFLQGLPRVCPVDNTPTRLFYQRRGDYDYFGVASTGTPVYTYPFGKPLKDSEGEFFEGWYDKQNKVTHRRWVLWDRDTKSEIIVWEDGKLLSKKTYGKVEQSGRPAQADPLIEFGTSLSDGVEVREVEKNPFLDDTVGASVGLMGDSDRKMLDGLGMAIYRSKDEWDRKKAEWCNKASGNRVSVTTKLTMEEGGKILTLANNTGRSCVTVLTKKLGMDEHATLSTIRKIGGVPVRLEHLCGGPLADVIKHLADLQIKQVASRTKETA